MVRKRKSKKVKLEPELNLSDVAKKFKFNYALIALALIIIFGFYLRFYHIEYPVIGYHNWKVTHYITEARNFAREGFFKYGFFIPMRDSMGGIDEQPDGPHNDTLPTISIVIGVLFKIFGESLVVARLANIFFSLGSIIAFYLLIKELFEREDLALLCAFLTAINPLFVFFSHNVQVINPGLFFMLLGSFFYIRWQKYQLNKNKFRDLYLAVTFITIGSMTKYTFSVIAIPILFSFPYKKIIKNVNTYVKPLAISALIASLFPLWILYTETYVKQTIFGAYLSQKTLDSLGLGKLIDFGILGDATFWPIMKSFVADNYTLLGVAFAFLGLIMFLFFYLLKNRDKLGYKFMFGYFLGLIVFMFVMGLKLKGHNYHQFPVAPLVIFFIAFFIEVIAKNISNLVKGNVKLILYISVIVLFLIIPFSQGKNFLKHNQDSRDRMFNTQFPGLDVAGEYINKNSLPDERIFHSSHQSFGVLWHADRKGYKGPRDVEYFKRAETDFNVQWIFVYKWGIQEYFQNQEIMDHIRNNYRLVQFAFIPVGNQAQPLYFLFRKGGTFNETLINEQLQNKPVYNRQYHYTHAPYEIRFINLE